MSGTAGDPRSDLHRLNSTTAMPMPSANSETRDAAEIASFDAESGYIAALRQALEALCTAAEEALLDPGIMALDIDREERLTAATTAARSVLEGGKE